MISLKITCKKGIQHECKNINLNQKITLLSIWVRQKKFKQNFTLINKTYSQFSPSHPSVHSHKYELIESTQTPSFKHGLLQHSFVSDSQYLPVNPCIQRQLTGY